NMSPEEHAKKTKQRRDLLAAYNFKTPENPLILELPQGWGEKFEKDLGQATNYILHDGIKLYEKQFESGFMVDSKQLSILSKKLKNQQATFQKEGQKIQTEIDKLDKLLQEAQPGSKEAEEYNKKIEKLSDEYAEMDKDSFEKELKIQTEMESLQSQNATDQKDASKSYKETVVKPELDQLKNKYPTKKIKEYLEQLEESMMHDVNTEISVAQMKIGAKMSGNIMMQMQMPPPPDMSPYQVKILNKIKPEEQIKGIPVIFEKKPTLEGMFGTIEASKYMLSPMGAEKPKKDQHLRMQAGTFMKALGGYFIVSMMKMAQKDVAAFERLIEDLDDRHTHIENARLKYYVPTASEELKSNIKVIINGNNSVYQQLKSLSKHELFEEFNKTFNIKSEFDNTTDNNKNNREQYSKYIARLCKRKGLKNVTSEGIAEIIEYSARLTSNQNELTLNIAEIAKVLREANLKAGNDKEITGENVAEAVKSIRGRHSLIKEKFQKFITKGKRILDTTGYVSSKINGIGVYTFEDIAFGEPMVITAVSSLGEGKMISVDRNAKMTGPIHDKAFGILEGNIKRLFGQDKHTPVNLSLSFEQNYGGVDGDSATLAEFLLTLSSLSKEPIYQGIAVTGSLNQLGEEQPIGGVNEKVEGVYEICKAKGLTGDQGVMIPKLNVDDLMLRDDILKAIEEKKFHVYAVGTPEEAIETIFGLKPGTPTHGKFEEGTLYYKVNEVIKEYNKQLKEQEEKK
ncbi:MAG: AAA family ATPase, partial [Nanoarchaeota archaeon]|nr:AAA family ATPase [Nanoarchaeota archaeon]